MKANSLINADELYLVEGDNEITITEATETESGLMSASDKVKLNGIEDGANKTIVDSALSSTSTNPVQNSIINAKFNEIEDSIAGKVDKVDGKELSTNDLTATLKSNYDSAYTHSQSAHAPADAEKNAIVGIQKNGTDLTVNSSTRKVNVTVPTKTSELTNDSNFATKTNLDTKVDKVSGKGLSTNDYTTAEKEKLAAIDDGANKTIVDTALSATSTNPVQNKVIKTKFDSVQSDIDSKVPSARTINGKALSSNITLSASDVGALPSTTQIPSIDGLATETYVDNKVAGLVDSAPAALDTLNELAAALGDDPNFATTIATQIGNKVDKVDGKGLSTNDYTTTEKSKLASIAEGAQVNQNAFSNVKVGSITVAADNATDTLTFIAGDNITLTPDATNDKITISTNANWILNSGTPITEGNLVEWDVDETLIRDTGMPSSIVLTSTGVNTKGNGNAVTSITSSGHLITFNKDSTFLTEHPTISTNTDTTSTVSPSHGGTFTVVDSVNRDSNGHVTKINTKTITLPSDNDTHWTSKNVINSGEGINNTTESITNGNVYLKHIENGSETSSHLISGSGATSVITDNSGNVTVQTSLSSSGSGNAVTNVSINEDGGGITITKGNSFLPLSGGTLTGNLTGKYITGTWLQCTAGNHFSNATTKIAVIDSQGWIYYRTPDEILSDIGAAQSYTYSDTDITAGTTSLETGKLYFVYE